MTKTEIEPCFSCGAMVPNTAGPVHRYMMSSPGCWAVYGEVLAKEFGDPVYFANHRMTVDAYAVQHPGSDDPQSIQSVAVHLISLYLVLEKGVSADFAMRALKSFSKEKRRFHRLTPPPNMGPVTVADVVQAGDPKAHLKTVEEWAQGAWNAWLEHHGQIRDWARNLES